MHVELIGGNYSTNLWDPGTGDFDRGCEWGFVEDGWSRNEELYAGEGWSGNFSVVAPGEPGRDVIVGGLGSDILKGVIGGLATDGVKIYWNWLIQNGTPAPNSNGVNWQSSPFFTQGA